MRFAIGPIAGLLVLASNGSAQDGVDFVRDVAPILQQRCIGCHGPQKQKGHFRLDRREFLFAGAADDWSVKPHAPDDSDLLRRVQLPADDDDAMPNEGERLSAAQVDALRRWIAAGAEWPPAGDEFFANAAAKALPPRIEFGIAAPDAALQQRIDAALQALVDRGAVAQRVAADTPAVDVNVALLGGQFGDADLAQLADLAPVLVWLNLARTAVTDAGLAALAPMVQLRRLNLANTAIGDAGLAALGPLPRLEVLNVYGSKVTDAALLALGGMPALRQVYAFQTAISAAGAARAVGDGHALAIDRGDYAEERQRAAQAEIDARAARDRPINATCPVTGEKIVAEQLVEHDGLRIGFCCAKCKKRFADDPAQFAAKIAEYQAEQQKRSGEPRRDDPPRDDKSK